MAEELVNARHAARAIGMSPVALYRAAESGTVPHFRMGRAVRFSITELRAWMKEQAGKPKAERKEEQEAVPA